MRSVVDLPAPDRPMMPTNCPRGIANDTSDTADDLPKLLVTPSRTSIGDP